MISAVSQRIWGTRIAWLLFAALIALFLFYGIELAHAAYLTAIFPGEFDYAEGIVWQQAKLIPGPRMYGDVQIYPYLVFHYPPFYHLVVHAAALLGIPWLMAGRLVSILSTVALGVIVAAFVSEATSRREIRAQSRWAGAAIAGLLLVTLRPIQLWAYAMRVDLLAVMLEFLGMYLGLCALRRPNLTIPAALAFVLAVYTKQTMLAGAIATFVALLVQAPARAFGRRYLPCCWAGSFSLV